MDEWKRPFQVPVFPSTHNKESTLNTTTQVLQ